MACRGAAYDKKTKNKYKKKNTIKDERLNFVKNLFLGVSYLLFLETEIPQPQQPGPILD